MATRRRGQYKLYAYVGPNGSTTPDVDGTVTFETVFIKRPDECRYAIVGLWDVAQHFEKILVWDLIKTLQSQSSGKLFVPKPIITCGDVDQAVMATLMLYEND